MKTFLLLASALLTSTAAQAADLGVADLPRIHAEYKANQARWAREFLDKTFAATMTLGNVSNVFGNDKFMVTFMEDPSDWMPGVACEETMPSDFLISKNKGDSIFVRGVVKDHSFGSLDLRDCEFFDSEKAAADADAKRLADEAAARDQAARQAAAITSVPDTPPAKPAQTMTQSSLEANKAWCGVLLSRSDPSSKALAAANCRFSPPESSFLPGLLNDTFRNMIQRTGKRCNAITDHVWITPDHTVSCATDAIGWPSSMRRTVGDSAAPANDLGSA